MWLPLTERIYYREPSLTISFRRAGSWESGFFSQSAADWLSESGGLLSSRSVASSLLTVSDLEEDLRAASAFLSNKRSSSVFTDSLDDLSYGEYFPPSVSHYNVMLAVFSSRSG